MPSQEAMDKAAAGAREALEEIDRRHSGTTGSPSTSKDEKEQGSSQQSGK